MQNYPKKLFNIFKIRVISVFDKVPDRSVPVWDSNHPFETESEADILHPPQMLEFHHKKIYFTNSSVPITHSSVTFATR